MKYIAIAQVGVLCAAFCLGTGVIATTAVVLQYAQDSDRPPGVSSALGLLPIAVTLLAWAIVLMIYSAAFVAARFTSRDGVWFASVRADVVFVSAFLVWGFISNVCITIAVALNTGESDRAVSARHGAVGAAAITWIVLFILALWFVFEVAYVKVEYGRLAAVWSQSLRVLTPERVQREGGKVDLEDPPTEKSSRSRRNRNRNRRTRESDSTALTSPMSPMSPMSPPPAAVTAQSPTRPLPTLVSPISPMSPLARMSADERRRQQARERRQWEEDPERAERHDRRRRRKERRLLEEAAIVAATAASLQTAAEEARIHANERARALPQIGEASGSGSRGSHEDREEGQAEGARASSTVAAPPTAVLPATTGPSRPVQTPQVTGSGLTQAHKSGERCPTCGSKSGNWEPEHAPPSSPLHPLADPRSAYFPLPAMDKLVAAITPQRRRTKSIGARSFRSRPSISLNTNANANATNPAPENNATAPANAAANASATAQPTASIITRRTRRALPIPPIMIPKRAQPSGSASNSKAGSSTGAGTTAGAAAIAATAAAAPEASSSVQVPAPAAVPASTSAPAPAAPAPAAPAPSEPPASPPAAPAPPAAPHPLPTRPVAAMSTKGPAVDKPMPPLPVDDSPPLSATIWSSVLPQLDNIIPLDGFSVPFFGDPGKGTEQLASAEPADDKAENSQANMFLAPAGASNNHNNPYYNDRLSRPTIASLDLSVKTRNSAVSGVSGANSDIGG